MCENISAFSKAFVDWSLDVDSHRLSTRAADHMQMLAVRARGIKPPSQAEEAEASTLLEPMNELIFERFGVDPVVARYMLCSQALVSGQGIVLLAEKLVRRLTPPK